MRKNLFHFCVTILCAFSTISYMKGNDMSDFRDKFYKAKSYLAGGLIDKALPLYKELYNADSTNSNISYLLGVCYTEVKSATFKSIYHLERGAQDISTDYNPGAYLESSAPIFTWYYLTIAYSQNGLCQKAITAAHKFKELYGAHKNDFYTKDATRWVARCNAEPKKTNVPLEDETIPISAQEKVTEEVVDVPLKDETIPISEQKVITKNVDYETKTPLYGVQVGAFSRLVPIWKFDNLSNVDAFMDNESMIRYVIGHFTFVSQANILLKAVWKASYNDAFIVDINSIKKKDDQRYKEAIVSVDDVSFKAKVRGKVDYRVQIGAFKESIPEDLVQLYLRLEGIKENTHNNVTSLTIGSYDDYKGASIKRRELMDFGIPGAFVVAYNYDRKIPVDEANYYTSKVSGDEIEEDSGTIKKKGKKRPKY